MTITLDIITRCPQCQTAFKATANVLRVANGTVRCGSCLSVFNAKQYAVNQPQSSETAEITKDEHQAPSSPDHQHTSHKSPTDIVDDIDERWALDLLKEEEKNSSKHISSNTPKTTPTHTSRDTSHDSDELFLDIMTNDLDNKASSAHQNDSEDSSTLHNEDNHHAANSAVDSLDSEQSLPLENINARALEIDEQITTPRRWPWVIGVVVLSISATLQLAWFQRDTLSLNALYRPYYEQACKHLPCKVAPRVNIDQIRTTHLVIRSHPSENNALVADAIIVNNANFEQQYPTLRLTFRNIHNKTVASRAFQPQEYLKGDLIGATVMPSKQPVQLSLAIVDPGESAVNYHIDILPSSP